MVPGSFTLFENKAIGRTLSPEGREAVIRFMVSKGNAEWDDAARTRVRIILKSADTLAGELYTWAMKAGYKNNVLTIYELHSSEEHEDTSFHGSDPVLIRRACEILEKSDKCIIFSGETADECGIKFL